MSLASVSGTGSSNSSPSSGESSELRSRDYAARSSMPSWIAIPSSVLVSIVIFRILGEIALLPLHMTIGLALISLALTLAMCLISAVLAVRRVISADPSEVF